MQLNSMQKDIFNTENEDRYDAGCQTVIKAVGKEFEVVLKPAKEPSLYKPKKNMADGDV